MGFLCAQRLRCGAVCAFLLLAPSLVRAAREAPAAASALLSVPFREAIERGVANGAYRSLGVGLIEGKRHGTFYFGHRDGGDSPPADDTSLFEIGAAGEVFTGVLFAQAAIEGKLRLADPIAKFLPAPFPFADARVGAITLEQLATQHSGLPAQPPNLFPVDRGDPYADYAAEDLLALLAFLHPDEVHSDAGYGYSVLNAGLLGHLLGRAYRMPLGEALAVKVFAPLGLKRTMFADEAALLSGYAFGERAARWHFGALAGAAGLRACLPDLLTFLQHNLTPDNSPLRAALLLARQPRASGPADRIALGWNVRERIDRTDTWPLVWRASRTAGFSSFLGFRTDRQKAIVLLGNSAEDVAALGIAWLGDALPPPPPPPGAAATGANRLEEYPGLYRIAPGVEAILRIQGNALSLQMAGSPPVPLRAAARDVFIADSGALGVTFTRDIDVVSGLMLHAGTGNISAARLSANAPHLARAPIPWDATARRELLGDYRLDAATWLRIGEAGQDVTVQWTLGERQRIFPFARDRYADADGTIELQVERDAASRLVGVGVDLAGARRNAVALHRNSQPERTP